MSVQDVYVILEKPKKPVAPILNPDAVIELPPNRIKLARTVLSEVAGYYCVPRDVICSDRRDAYIATPRQIAQYITSRYTLCTLLQIASIYGRDHTTVMHSIRKIDRLLSEGNVRIGNDIDHIVRGIRGLSLRVKVDPDSYWGA